jgi:hypothetical protein
LVVVFSVQVWTTQLNVLAVQPPLFSEEFTLWRLFLVFIWLPVMTSAVAMVSLLIVQVLDKLELTIIN